MVEIDQNEIWGLIIVLFVAWFLLRIKTKEMYNDIFHMFWNENKERK